MKAKTKRGFNPFLFRLGRARVWGKLYKNTIFLILELEATQRLKVQHCAVAPLPEVRLQNEAFLGSS